MSNLTDALIAAKLVGGSGGSGGGSGLPEITNVEKELYHGTPSFVNQGGEYLCHVPLSEPISVSVGDSVQFTFDGTSYNYTVSEIQDSQDFGNLSLAGAGEDTGEPFVASLNPQTLEIMTTNAGATHEVALSATVQYPPDGTALVVKNGEWAFQSGYGYIDDDVVIPIKDDILPRSQVYKIVIQNDAAVTVPSSAVHMFSFDYVMLGSDGQPMPASQLVPSQFLTWKIVKGSTNYQGSLQVRYTEIRRTGANIQVFNTSSSSVTIPAGAYFHIICTNPYQIEVSQGSGGSNV